MKSFYNVIPVYLRCSVLALYIKYWKVYMQNLREPVMHGNRSCPCVSVANTKLRHRTSYRLTWPGKINSFQSNMILADPGWCDLLAPLQPEFISIPASFHLCLQPLSMCCPVALYSWLCYCLCFPHYYFCAVATFVLFVWLRECTKLMLRLSFCSLCCLSSVSCYAGPDPWPLVLL